MQRACAVANIVTLEKQYYIFWVCVCSLMYPACDAHALLRTLLHWKNSKYYIFWVCVCSLMYPAYKAHVLLRTLLHWKNSKYYIFWVCVCSLYPVCKAHALYCHLWPVRLHNIFPHYLINGAILDKMLLKTKCMFWISLQLLSQAFLILRRTERDMTKNVYWSSCNVPVIRVRF